MNTIIQLKKVVIEIHKLLPQILPSAIVLAIIEAIFPFFNIYFTTLIVDELIGNKNIDILIKYISFLLIANFILFIISRSLEEYYLNLRSELYIKERNKISFYLCDIDYEYLENQKFKSQCQKYTEGVELVGSAFYQMTGLIYSWVKGCLCIICSIAFIFPVFQIGLEKSGDSFIESPWMLITIIISIIISVIFILIISSKLNKKWFYLNDEYISMNALFSYYWDLLTDYRKGKDIRLYSMKSIINEHATKTLLNDGEKVQKKIAHNSAINGFFIALISSVLGFGVYIFVGIKGLIGSFSIGYLVRYLSSFLQIVDGVILISSNLGQLSSCLKLSNYYFNILNTPPKQRKGNMKIHFSDEDKYIIEFKNVSFKYPGSSEYSLKDVSIKIYSGEHIAIVGENGSGKTTFIKLLCRLYEPTDGEILINGIPIYKYDINDYRNILSVIFQDYDIFAFTLGENVAASKSFDNFKIKNSLNLINFNFSDKFEKNFDTHLYKDFDENGIEISGGEAQKIALSRVLYKDSPIVILDEPTASLDPNAEQHIYSIFNNNLLNKTVIYISHRMSACKISNKIAVFDCGKLIQYGTHEELVKNKKMLYYKMWSIQSKFYTEI